MNNGEDRLTINWMKKLLVVLALVSLTGSAAFAQRVHSDNQDFKFTAGVRIPLKNTSANSGEVMSLTYGKYNDKGFVSSRYCKGEISEMGADEPITYEENVTYDHTKIDEQGNWTKRTCHGATGRDPWTETRTIVYY